MPEASTLECSRCHTPLPAQHISAPPLCPACAKVEVEVNDADTTLEAIRLRKLKTLPAFTQVGGIITPQ